MTLVTETGAGPELTSDKHYWHRYTDTYQQAFQALSPVTDILEFGVLRGASIAWMAKRFPAARDRGSRHPGADCRMADL